MRDPRHCAPTTAPKKLATTLGDLISAAYEASEGAGRRRAECAANLLTESTLARRCSPQLRFVR